MKFELKTISEILKYRKKSALAVSIIIFLVIVGFFMSRGNSKQARVVDQSNDLSYKKNRIIVNTGQEHLLDSNRMLLQKIDEMREDNKNALEVFSEKIKRLEAKASVPQTKRTLVEAMEDTVKQQLSANAKIKTVGVAKNGKKKRSSSRSVYRGKKTRGKIIYDVKLKKSRPETLPIPSGSYVKGKLLTGTESSEGAAAPVLIQLDYANVLPNRTSLDLTGCFMLAKTKGNLSIERVEMKAYNISCISKSGKLYEEKIKGFIVDDKDNSFAIKGKVNSKRDRAALMAFGSEVVNGIASVIQASGMTSVINPLGGIQHSVNRNITKTALAGGISRGAQTITDWYLNHANSLKPTINVGSGQDVWVVMMETARIPKSHFANRKKTINANMKVYGRKR